MNETCRCGHLRSAHHDYCSDVGHGPCKTCDCEKFRWTADQPAARGKMYNCTMLTDEQLKEWRVLCERATAGPWEWADVENPVRGSPFATAYGIGVAGTGAEWSKDSVVAPGGSDHMEVRPSDMDFIATARTAMPALLDEVERLRAALAEAEEKLKQPCVHDLVDKFLRNET